MQKTGTKKKSITAVTPIGFISYPYLLNPDEGRENSDGKYKGDLFIPKKEFKTDAGKALIEKTLSVARKFFHNDDLRLPDFANPLQDVDKLSSVKRKELPEAIREGFIRLRAKRIAKIGAPVIVDASKEDLSEKEIQAIKGGDVVRFQIAIFPYKHKSGGVAYGLNLVQFIKHGKAFGQGKSAALAMLDDIEIEADALDEDDNEAEDTTDEGDEDSKPRSKNKRREVDEDAEESEDDSSDSDDDDEPVKKKKSKRASSEEDDEDEFS